MAKQFKQKRDDFADDETKGNLRRLTRQGGKGQFDYFMHLQAGRSLIFTINASGARSWSVLFYEGDKQRRKKIGEWRDGCKPGKDDLRKWHDESSNVDAVLDHAKKAGKRDAFPALCAEQAIAVARAFKVDEQARVEKGSFKDVAEQWFANKVEMEGYRSEAEKRRHLDRYIYPKWEHKAFVSIDREAVHELLDGIDNKHHRRPRMANCILATVSSIMTWKQIRDSKYTSPIVRGMKRKERGARDRILADDEIKAVWKAASQESAGAFGAIVRLSLITAQRRDKIASLKWADIDDKGYWTVATEEGEKGNIAKTKLPDVALAIIDAQPRKDDSPYVFASDWTRRRKGEDERREASYFSAWSQGKHGLDKLLPEMPAWTVHDCRRTARSLMARLGVLPHVSERVLGHAMPGTVGVYDRYSYTDEKAAALEKLAGFIDRLVNQPERSNVVEMQKPRRKTKRAKAA